MWSDPAKVARWWGTAGSTSSVIEWDFRRGGAWHIDMHAASGAVYANRGIFSELITNETIAYTDVVDPGLCWSDGRPAPIGAYTITFAENGPTTVVTIHARFESVENAERVRRSGMIEGIGEGLTRLQQLLNEEQP